MDVLRRGRYLDPQPQLLVGPLHPLEVVLQLFGLLHVPLHALDVVHGRFQDGAFVPARVPVDSKPSREDGQNFTSVAVISTKIRTVREVQAYRLTGHLFLESWFRAP